LVIPMLKNNLELKKASILYFGKKKCIEEWNILNKYNLDKNSLYGEELPLKIAEPPLEAGNIDDYLQASMKIADKINENNLINKDIFYILKKLLIELPNLVINPSKYKIIFSDDHCKWQYYTIPQLKELFKIIVQEENMGNKSSLNELMSEVFCLYMELKECRRYNEDKSFSRIGKDYEIINMIKKLIQRRESKMIVGTHSSFERNMFQREIGRLGLADLFLNVIPRSSLRLG